MVLPKQIRWLTGILLLMLSTASSADRQAGIQQVRAELLENLASATTQQEGRTAENAMWQFWFSLSPTVDVRQSLDAGIERREAYDFEAAENHFDRVIEEAPAYAEGYNQRAFIRFLRENFDESQVDLEKALELEPDHFGALAGLYQILRIQNRYEAALSLLQQAVTIHPWLQERGSLPKELWPDRYRDIHDPELEI